MKNKNLIIIIYSSWSGLGFIRGINYYKYNNNKYNNNKYITNEPYMYSNSILYGMYGMIKYSNPFLLPFTIYKELYKLEVNIRDLKDVKNDSYYNEL